MRDDSPAFPVPGLQHDESFNGITMRDYFAAKAMQVTMVELSDATAAVAAYKMADAMLAARQS